MTLGVAPIAAAPIGDLFFIPVSTPVIDTSPRFVVELSERIELDLVPRQIIAVVESENEAVLPSRIGVGG